MSKPLSIKYPSTEDEAIEICIQLAEAFRFKFVLIQKSDFEDMMGTEEWTEEDYKNAVEIATDEVGEGAGFAIQNAIEEINGN